MEFDTEKAAIMTSTRHTDSNDLNLEDDAVECPLECPLDGLPFEILLHILARVPRSTHKSIRATCRSWAQLLRGTELYELRRDAFLQEDWLYVLAGARGSHSLRLEGFDPLEETPSPMPTEISMHPDPPPANLWGCQVAALGFDIFVLGGSVAVAGDTTFPLDSVWSYDVRTKKWRQRASMLTARRNFGCATLDGGVRSEGHRGLVVAGGWGEDRLPLDSAELYDPEKDTWVRLAPMTRHRAECQAALFAGKVHVIGGIDRQRNGTTTTTLTLVCGEVLTLGKDDDVAVPPISSATQDVEDRGGGLEIIEANVPEGMERVGWGAAEAGGDVNLDDGWLAPLPGWVVDRGREEAGKGSGWRRVEGMWRNISLPGSLVVMPDEGRLLGVADIARKVVEYHPLSNSWQDVICAPNHQRGFQLASLNGGLLLLGVYGGKWVVPQRQVHAPTEMWSGLALLHNEALGVTTLGL